MQSNAQDRILVILCSPFYLDKGSAVRARSNLIAMSNMSRVDVVTYPVGKPVSLQRVRLVRARAPGYRRIAAGPSPLKPYADLMVFLRAFVVLVKHKSRYSLISGEDIEGGIVGLFLSKLFGMKYAYSMYNPLENTLKPYWSNSFLLGVARMVDRVLEKQKRIVVEWEYERERLIRKGASGKIEVVPDAFPEAESSPEGVELPDTFFCYAGNAKTYQGLELLLGAFARVDPLVRRKKPLVLVGPKFDDVRGLVTRTGLSESLYVLGSHTLLETNYIISRASFCVLPRTRDGAPGMKVLHYFSRGQPTLATDLPCNRLFVEPGITGNLVASSIEPFASELQRWMEDTAYVDSLRKNVLRQEWGSQQLANGRMARFLTRAF